MTIADLNDAVTVAGRNGEHDIIDLGGINFVLTNELVLRSDGGRGLVLRDGTLERSDSAEPFRLLRLNAVPEHAKKSERPVIIDAVKFRNGQLVHSDPINESLGGGGILSNRTTLISNSTFMNNRVLGNLSGGAISHTQVLQVSKSHFINNEAIPADDVQTSEGGAIAAKREGNLYIAHSYFFGNSADHGGAVHAGQHAEAVNITRSSFDTNTAWKLGGAVWTNVGKEVMRVSNSSFTANHAPDGGGAIYTQALYASVQLKHLTFANNESNRRRGGAIRAMIPRDGSTVSLINSILTNNSGGNCGDTQGGELQFYNSTNNLVDDKSCGATGITEIDTNATVFDGELNYYGGSVPTIPIFTGGPANNHVPREDCMPFDSRDIPRLDNGDSADEFCDAGAFEFVPLEQIDYDGDNVRDFRDNCINDSNSLQSDIDNDGLGDACDTRDDRDSDGDAVPNFGDNCLNVDNFLQLDTNRNGIGDACESKDDYAMSMPPYR